MRLYVHGHVHLAPICISCLIHLAPWPSLSICVLCVLPQRIELAGRIYARAPEGMAAAASKIGERDGRIVVSLDSDGRKYYPKGNFTVTLTHEVDAGERSGYICEVIYFTGERLGYVITRKIIRTYARTPTDTQTDRKSRRSTVTPLFICSYGYPFI